MQRVVDLSRTSYAALLAAYRARLTGDTLVVLDREYAVTLDAAGGVSFEARETPEPPRDRRYQRLVKPVLDRVAAALALLVLSPVLLAIGLAVVLDSRGPVFYRATVVGRGGRPFVWLKFRSMRPDADAAPVRTEALQGFIASRERWNQYDRSYKVTDDRRVTRVGHFLRRYSLDELPQLWAILRGQMSLVGPRPCLPAEFETYEPWQRERYAPTPGLTGLWQVHPLKNRMPLDELVLIDVFYARNCSLWLDLRAILATFRVVLSGTNES